MKKRTLLALGLALTLTPLASAQTIGTLVDGLDAFAKNTPAALPFAAGAGIDWSNAYTGQLIDGDFPYIHLAAGVTAGFTTLPGKAISPLLEALGSDPVDLLPVPFAVANLRVGGLILPFDVGLKAGFLPDSLSKATPGYTFEYKNFGLDVRYNLVKSDFLLPDISVGGGINYLKAGFSTELAQGKTYTNPTNNHQMLLGPPTFSLDMESTNFEVKGQISKTIFFLLTPYLGATAYVGSANAKASILSLISYANGGSAAEFEPYVGPITAVGFAKKGEASPFGLKIYGGTSVNILILKIDGQLMYNLTDGAAGVTIGARLQL